MFKNTIHIKNGLNLVPYNIYKCDKCGCDIEESWPFVKEHGKHYCGDCAFKLKKISGATYINEFVCFSGLNNLRAGVNPLSGNIEITSNSKFSWETNNKEIRKSAKYLKWRFAVLKRDKFTCAVCGKVGGHLEAHHIKTFSKHIKERFSVSNGITLCTKCHKQVHRSKNHEWLYIDK